MSKIRFINEQILLEKLPVFLCGTLTEVQLEKLADLIEEELILSKAKEILDKRSKND